MSRHILTFSLFEATKTSGLTPEQEEFLNKYTKDSWSYDPATGLVDVDGDFDCSNEDLENFKGVKFGKVSGNFVCNRNKLVSLEGAPREVGEDFDCRNNKLTSLEGAPQEVGRSFLCMANKLTSLEGAPQKVGLNFRCDGNLLTSLKGAPQKIVGSFYCSTNKLTSLEGAPQEVGSGFWCYGNALTTLEGAPLKIGDKLGCDAFELDLLDDGEWNLKGWLKIMKEGSQKARRLIQTILTPEFLNREIQKDPAGMAMDLKSVWNDRRFKDIKGKLVWPQGYEQEADLLGDLDDVGF